MKAVRGHWAGVCILAACAALAAGAPVRRAAAAEDAGAELEGRLGLVGRSTAEGRKLNDQLGAVAERIAGAASAGRDGSAFQLRGARILGGRSGSGDRVVNAYALPDGRLYVTLGLMRLLQESPRCDDELAYVLGHAVSHVVERHTERRIGNSASSGVMAVLVIALAGSKAADVGAMGAAAYASHFSRQDEDAADRGTLLAMQKAGFDPRAAGPALTRLRGGSEGMNGWTGSHPLTSSRIDRVTRLAAELEPGCQMAELR